MKSYAHFREFDVNPLTASEIKKIIDNKKAIYNLNVDKTKNKFDLSEDLIVSDVKELPSYVFENIKKYKEWIA